MSLIATVGFQLAASPLVTYPYEVVDLSLRANYQPKPDLANALSAPASVRLTSMYATLKHHLLTSPQGVFELFRGIVPYLFYGVVYSSLLPAYLSLFRAVIPAPILGLPTGVVWKDALPLEAHQTLAVSTWKAILQPLTSLFYRTLLTPASRKLAPILPSASALWNATTQPTSVPHVSEASSSSRSVNEAKHKVNKVSDKLGRSGIASLFLPRVALLEFSHGIVSGAAGLFIAQAGLPILTYMAPQHFPPSPRGFRFDLLNAALWALGGVALRLPALALRTVAVRLSVQDTANAVDVEATDEEDKGASKITLRPKRYGGVRDAFAAIVNEEGAGALVRGWVVALFLDAFAVSTTLMMAAASIPEMMEGPF